ncbi:FAD-dependent oxidoreductase [Spongiactinospora sp. TRM90649]|uniref:FAD-dependent oxidoreductase n=1 Tax=Spongiactinospora sp. TRM90649 TaxID=3031114 RepID=UPI0023F75C22|nr:FAD-dependent oxidoreductase [Spongiactinospora sp. TRM90649]MDF5755181.1 FAD-dependent oxidoreductase [Spongiactinospora sp. TRM90649]
MDTDVLVVGAGPVGLALACALLQHGVRVRVIDKAAGPATTSRANFVHARGSEVLDRLGALSGLPEESVRAMTITTYAGDRPMMRIRFGDPGLGTAAPPMVISQARVEARLRERLAELGGHPEWGSALVEARQDATGVTATVADGRSIRAGWLAGCDGTGSTVRKLAGIGFPGVKVSERFLLVDGRLDPGLDRSGTSGWAHPDGVLGAMPMPGDQWRLLAYDAGFRDDKPSEEQIADRMRHILPARTGLSGIRLYDVTWASLFSVHRRLADTYRAGRVLLAGDAAHVHAPFGGQGMLTGLGDAENLAWKLALVVRGRAQEALLDTYQAERRPLATAVLRGSTAATKLNIAAGPIGRFLRDQVLMRIFSRPWIQRWTTYSTSQLWVSYRRGPLGGRGRKPRPGDRLADLPCERPDGGRTRLHAELRGRWAVLGDRAAFEAARRRLGDRVVHLQRPGPAMLVRPDGHLAGKGGPADFTRWLNEALG